MKEIRVGIVNSASQPRGLRFSLVAGGLAIALSGCVATAPKLGDAKGTVTGAAGGAAAEGENNKLARCDETLGTLAMQEDQSAPWYAQLRQHQLGSTIPVLRLMIQQSNCFVIVERGAGMQNMMQERALQQSGEMRAGSNFDKGQMVAADYLMRPAIQFSGKSGGGGGFLGGGALGLVGALAGSVGRNEASTTLLLIDSRSGVQISAAEGSAKNFDFGFFGASFTSGLGGGGGGYANTPQGKVVTAAFADSFNQMVTALKSYKAQTVKGGLGAGGRLGVSGGTTPASQEASKAAPAATGSVKPVSTQAPSPAGKK